MQRGFQFSQSPNINIFVFVRPLTGHTTELALSFGVHVRLVVECVVYIGNVLLVSVSFREDSCCVWSSNLSASRSPCALRVLS
jgi:hypothetical protein